MVLPAQQEDIGQEAEPSPHPHPVELDEDGDEEEPESGEVSVGSREGQTYLVHISTAISWPRNRLLSSVLGTGDRH